ncbi:hypothetical protein DW020_03535 [Clostridium sp. AF37-5AT]|nr:hypothetical protein [Clostridium sp. AF37-5AT]RHO96845.1 hypothetical protein DW020_03535 [Clostridium sp. AF37-5AT]
MPEYVKEYFSSALDFAGEEQGDTYRKYCVIQLIGSLAWTAIISCMRQIITLFGPELFIILRYLTNIITLVGWAVITVPNIAATVRRTRILKRSKLWAVGIAFSVILFVPIAWWVLGKDKAVEKW